MLQLIYLVSRAVSAWPLVVRRSLAHWRLLSTVVVGVVLSSAVMAGTVIYYDALRELALKSTLASLTEDEANILVKADRGPTTVEEFAKVDRTVNGEVDARVAWFLESRVMGAKTATFFLSRVGHEAGAGQDNARSYFAYVPTLDEHIRMVSGGWGSDAAPSAPGQPLRLQAIVPAESAELFGVGVGDSLSTVPYWNDAIPYATVTIAGIFERTGPDEFWHLNDAVLSASTSGNFRTVPFFLTRESYFGSLGASFTDMDSTYAWLLQVDQSKLDARNAWIARSNLETMRSRLARNLFSYRQITELEDALAEYDKRLFFSKLPMFVVLVLISVVILYYVVTISSLVVEQQRGEIALLRSRGASSPQILAVFVLEGLTISLLAAAAAPPIAALVISVLGYSPAFSGLSGGDRLDVAISGAAFAMGALGGLLSFAALLIPAVQASRVGVTRHRQESARPTSQPFFLRYYFDVLLLVISVVLFRQLSDQGSVVASSVFGELVVNQALLAVPALVLVAVAMVLLRLFPLAIRFLSGDSPSLLHLVAGATAAILAPAIVVRAIGNGEPLIWLVQLAALAALVAAYWFTTRTDSPLRRWAGLAAQAALVAVLLFVGPTLPMPQVFAPILIAVPIAQVAFRLLHVYGLNAPVGFSMGMWQMARRPTHYARLSLLLVLMAGLGIVAASFGGTLERSFEERARYSAGADIRLEGVIVNTRGQSVSVVDEYKALPNVSKVGPAFRGAGSDLSELLGESYTMVAVDSRVVSDVGWFRDDFADEPLPDLLAELEHPSLPVGLLLPPNSSEITLLIKTDRPQPDVGVIARVRDSNGRYFTYIMGPLNSTRWERMTAPLYSRTGRVFSGRRQLLTPARPLELVSVTVNKFDGRGRLRAGTISISEISVWTSDGEQVVEAFDDVSGWSIVRAAPESISDAIQPAGSSFDGDSGALQFVWTEGNPLVSRGIFHGPPITPVPVLASGLFLKETGHDVGDSFEVSVQGHRLQVHIVDAVDFFPTLDTFNRTFLVSDLKAVTAYANLDVTAGELRPNEMWIETSVNGSERAELVGILSDDPPFPARRLHDTQQNLAESQVDPLVQAGWRALLFMAFAAVLILSGLGFLVHAYVSFRSREMEFALMRTIGFSTRQLVTLIWLEQALIIVAGLALGTWMGGRIGAIIMPFLSNDDQGSQVLPPFVLEVNWTTLSITYAIMAVAFTLIITGMIWFVRRISLQRILRLGEL